MYNVYISYSKLFESDILPLENQVKYYCNAGSQVTPFIEETETLVVS